MRFVGFVKGLAEGYAIQSEDSAFEEKHLSDVAYFAEKLAIERNLDPNIALIIAYGHDLGRLKNGVYGKGHSLEGEKIISTLLETSNVEADNRKIIKEAVRMHNKKAKIHNPYSELIKDADALAHNEEGVLDPEDGYEYYRIVASELDEIELTIAPIDLWLERYSSCLLSFIENLQDKAKFLEMPDRWVHEQRVLIRQVRSILWYFKKSNSHTENAYHLSLIKRLTHIEDTLKSYFMTLREARQYFIYSEKELDGLKNQIYKNKYLKSLYKLEGQFDAPTTQALLLAITDEYNTAQYDYANLSLNPSTLVDAFYEERRLLIKASVHDIKRLHRVRISGKKFKYLSELGLMTYNHIAIKEVIDRVHDHIGKLNDYSEIMNLYNWKKHFNASEISFDLKKHQRKCRELIFFFHLISKSEIKFRRS